MRTAKLRNTLRNANAKRLEREGGATHEASPNQNQIFSQQGFARRSVKTGGQVVAPISRDYILCTDASLGALGWCDGRRITGSWKPAFHNLTFGLHAASCAPCWLKILILIWRGFVSCFPFSFQTLAFASRSAFVALRFDSRPRGPNPKRVPTSPTLLRRHGERQAFRTFPWHW
jgi:hypothetical protein